MSVTSRYLLRLAIKEALKEKRRRKWRDRFLRWKIYLAEKLGNARKQTAARWQKLKGKPITPPAKPPTTPLTTGTPVNTNSTVQTNGWPKLPLPIYIFMAMAVMGLAAIVYGIYSPGRGFMSMPMAILTGVITMLVMLLAYLAYFNKNGPIRWRVWQSTSAAAPAQPTTAAGTPPQATATAAAVPVTNWLGVAARIVVGLVLLAIVVVGGWKLMSWATTPTVKVATPAETPAPTAALATPLSQEEMEILPRGPSELVVTAEKDKWSKTYFFPPNMMVDYRAINEGYRYKMRVKRGNRVSEYTFTPEKSDVVPGIVPQAQFMAIGDRPEEILLSVYHMPKSP
jgi:hypothetical protein